MNKKIYIYDLETLNIFTATFIDRDSDETRVFIYTEDINQIPEMIEFLNNEVAGLVGFNCINFDSQIIEFIYRNPDCTPLDIRNYAMLITSQENNFPDVPEWKLRIPHLDLYKLYHFDNKNKRTSLKWCEYMMDLENIEDMPSQGSGNNWVDQVVEYNFNDVIATKELYLRSRDMIDLRNKLSKKYHLNLLNANNGKIGTEILLKLYCEKTGKYKSDVRSMRTYRKGIHISDIIFPYIQFKYPTFQNLLKQFQSKIVNSTKGDIEFSVNYKEFQFDYGSGGIHGSLNNKLIESDEEYVIIDSDVASLYPSIAVINKLYPQHLGPEFYEVYKNDIVDVRLGEKAKGENGDKAIIKGFKEAANIPYGKSNDVYSWLYDPKYTLQTTINGQLALTMLAESLMDIKNLQLIQINTDGLTAKLPKSQIENYYKTCSEWEKLTKFKLEHADYKKMIIFDVNNYIGVYTNDKTKCKGRCEFENIPLHKNKSHNIIPIAFYEYFVNNKSIEDTIYNHKNIFDFCAGVRVKNSPIKGQSNYELHYVEDGNLKIDKLSKTVRYYISNKGKTLIKRYGDGSFAHVEAPKKVGKLSKDWKVTYFNKAFYYDNMKKYDIDYSYYISKTKEWIYVIEDKSQLTLF
jgi:hypothetical protein